MAVTARFRPTMACMGSGYSLCMVVVDERIADPKPGQQFHIDRFEKRSAFAASAFVR